MTNGESVKVVQDAQSFAELDQAARVEQVMGLDRDRQIALLVHLAYENHGDIKAMKSQRQFFQTVAHVITGVLAAVVGLFGQPYTPGQ